MQNHESVIRTKVETVDLEKTEEANKNLSNTESAQTQPKELKTLIPIEEIGMSEVDSKQNQLARVVAMTRKRVSPEDAE